MLNENEEFKSTHVELGKVLKKLKPQLQDLLEQSKDPSEELDSKVYEKALKDIEEIEKKYDLKTLVNLNEHLG